MNARPTVLTGHLGYWLRFVSNHVSEAFAAKLARKGVNVAEWVMMRAVFDGDATAPSQLARKLGMTRGGITKLADRLIAKGFVVREPSHEDGRAQRLKLTATGARMVPKLAALADENDREFFDHLTQSDRDTLEHILKRIAEKGGFTAVPLS